ncbi:MAG: DUF4175 family protein, partial [Pseudomonadota bacterium]
EEPDGDAPGSGDETGELPGPGQGGEGEQGFGTDESADEAFGRARNAMRESESALQRGDLRGSRQAQADAIDALRAAGDALAEQLERQMDEGDESRDPLGRSGDAINSDNAEADIDPQDNAERSREIIEELRRRAAEAERDQQEQDYLERLLRRF